MYILPLIYPDVKVLGDVSDYIFPMFTDNFVSMEVGEKNDLAEFVSC